MYISLQWISQYVDIDFIKDAERFAHLFTTKVAEIEKVIYQKDQYKDIVAVRIDKMTHHPSADKLWLVECTDDGRTLTIVTGAQNLAEGDIVPLARIGATIPLSEKCIEKTEFRGVMSDGMLCSSQELKLDTDHSGIMKLPADTKPGMAVADIFKLYDVIFLVDNKSLTNRPDLWGHYGIAREIAAVTGKPLRAHVENGPDLKNSADIAIDIESLEDTPAYCAVLISNLTRKESPLWLKQALYRVNQRPISFLVDLTNYIMYDVGQPCHAFDCKKIRKPSIHIRRAKPGEKVVTLDGASRECLADTLLIADSQDTPIAIAGVMGLANSEISDDTNSLLLELANFNQALIRKSSIGIGLRTDASIRFEKSLDPAFIGLAMEKFAALIRELDPSALFEGMNWVGKREQEDKTIQITTDFINRRLGTDINDAEIIRIIKSLGFGVNDNSGVLTVTVPSWRATKDVSIREDIVEEVGRIFGYGNIVPKAPEVALNIPHKIVAPAVNRRVRDYLVNDCGYAEVLNYPFSAPEDNEPFGFSEPWITLKNPLDKKNRILQKTLLPHLCANIADNLRFYGEFKICEIEHVFQETATGEINEPEEIAGAVVLQDSDQAVYEARDTLVGLYEKFNANGIEIEPDAEKQWLHPYRSGKLIHHGETIGIFGELSPDICNYFDIKRKTALFMTWSHFLERLGEDYSPFRKISRYPATSFDLAFVVPERLHVQDVVKLVQGADPLIRSVSLFDIYSGSVLGSGKKSLALNIAIGSEHKTLASEEMHAVLQKIVALMAARGFELRK